MKRSSFLLPLFLALIGTVVNSTSAAENSARRPNVLWLIAEDFCPDLGCYGTKQVWTPNLDRLAGQGMRYTRTFTTAPVCSASRSAFMTGMYQITIGAQHHRSHRDDGFRVPEGVKPLTDWFRQAGYYTANLVDMPESFGFKGTGKTDWNFTYEKPFEGKNWDDLKAHQPFYAQINFQETHRKYHAPPKADPAKVDLPPIYPDHPVARKDWAEYLDSATELDHKIGLVLAQLEKDGLADNTIILFIGDHGESHVRGKQFCYDDGLMIPLLIRWAKSFPAPKNYQVGGVSDRLIEAIDFGPTFLDAAAGFAKPAKMQGQIFLGDHADPPRQFAHGARDRCDETMFRFRTVRDARYRYIKNFMPERPFLQANDYKERSYPVWNLIKELGAQGKLTDWQKNFYLAPTMPPEELFDTQADPWCMNNLVASTKPDDQAALKRLRAELEKWLVEADDQGRFPEPPEVTARKGATKPGSADGGEGGEKKAAKKGKKKQE